MSPVLSDARDLLTNADPVAAFNCAHLTGESVALRTSGTTGSGRCVVRSTTSWTASFPHVSQLLELGPSSRVWVPGSWSATMNLFAIVHANYAGAKVVDRPEKATHVHMTASYLARLLHRGEDLSGRHLVIAGERLSRGLAEQAVRAGARTSHYYGSAELSFVAWGSNATDLHPFPGVDLELRDSTIWVRSPYLCHGHLGDPGSFQFGVDGFATVGDRGSWCDDRLQVEGRGNLAVTTGAATVLISDIEPALQAAASGDVVVVGLPHADLAHVVAVVLADEADFERVRETARSSLQGAHLPRRWFTMSSLPVTEAGKLDRPALVRALVSRDPGVRVLV